LEENVLLQAVDVVRSIWPGACWLPKGGLPTTVGLWEGRVDRVKSVVIKGVVDADFLTVRPCDGDLLQRDDFGRGNCVGCPIPVRLTKVYGGLFPGILIDSIFRSNTDCELLQDLLIKQEVVS